jgi:uncharacterized iron-regulated membrane protein
MQHEIPRGSNCGFGGKGPYRNAEEMYMDRQATAGTAHMHRASCHGPIGELQCDEAWPMAAQQELLEAKESLHWFQIFTNIVIILTCIAVVISLVEAWYVWVHIQMAINQFSNEMKGIGN